MKTQIQHTPTPWHIAMVNGEFYFKGNPHDGEVGTATDVICKADTINPKDAAFIVRAVNAHEGLLKASKDQYACLKKLIREGLLETQPDYIQDAVDEALESHEQALAKAKGKE